MLLSSKIPVCLVLHFEVKKISFVFFFSSSWFQIFSYFVVRFNLRIWIFSLFSTTYLLLHFTYTALDFNECITSFYEKKFSPMKQMCISLLCIQIFIELEVTKKLLQIDFYFLVSIRATSTNEAHCEQWCMAKTEKKNSKRMKYILIFNSMQRSNIENILSFKSFTWSRQYQYTTNI